MEISYIDRASSPSRLSHMETTATAAGCEPQTVKGWAILYMIFTLMFGFLGSCLFFFFFFFFFCLFFFFLVLFFFVRGAVLFIFYALFVWYSFFLGFFFLFFFFVFFVSIIFHNWFFNIRFQSFIDNTSNTERTLIQSLLQHSILGICTTIDFFAYRIHFQFRP